jgi:hypothetical protein
MEDIGVFILGDHCSRAYGDWGQEGHGNRPRQCLNGVG